MALIIGAGAVGTILAGYLSKARQPVRMYLREKDVERYSHAHNLQIDRVQGSPPIIAPKPGLTTRLDLSDEKFLILCVKYPALAEVLDSLPDSLPKDLTIVSTLNGVGAIREIRERFPGQPTAVITVMFNAQVLEPLHACITTKPAVLINSENRELVELFERTGMLVTAGTESSAWGKLLINLANAICAVTHTTFRDLLTNADLRRIFVATLDEAVSVLSAAGIKFDLPIPMGYAAYRRVLLHGGPLPWWFAKLRNGLQAGSFPSMVADVDAGRVTEVRQLNGEIMTLGHKFGIDTPINAQLVEQVESLAEQQHPDYLRPREFRQRLSL